jgi:hypothetical protein
LGLGTPNWVMRRLVGHRGDPGPTCEHWIVAADHLREDRHPEQGEEAQRKEESPSPQLTLAPVPGTEAKPSKSPSIFALHGESVGAAAKPALRND